MTKKLAGRVFIVLINLLFTEIWFQVDSILKIHHWWLL